MKNMYGKGRKSGFTLIEVLFAMALILAATLIVAGTMPLATISRGKADYLNRASGLAQKQLEAIKGLGYANANPTQLAAAGLIDSAVPVSLNTYSFTNSDATQLDNPSRVLPSGTGTVKIEQPQIDLAQITVTVSYSDTTQLRTVTVGTLIANI